MIYEEEELTQIQGINMPYIKLTSNEAQQKLPRICS